MKRRFAKNTALIIALMLVLTSCGNISEAKKNTTDNIAPDSDVIEKTELVSEDTVSIEADNIVDGTYEVTVDTDSSMFVIRSCTLEVKDGVTNATAVVDSDKYPYLYLGTSEDAVTSDGNDYIEAADNGDGTETIEFAVDSLDKVYDLATYSSKKEMWYGRQLVIRADSLPVSAYKNAPFDTVESLGLADGIYSIDVEMAGGSGRASIESPATMTISGGKATASITWSSPYYDYMLVKGERYEPVNSSGNSTFEIPVEAFNYRIVAIGDTTAMSKPHEITYSFTFKSDSMKEN